MLCTLLYIFHFVGTPHPSALLTPSPQRRRRIVPGGFFYALYSLVYFPLCGYTSSVSFADTFSSKEKAHSPGRIFLCCLHLSIFFQMGKNALLTDRRGRRSLQLFSFYTLPIVFSCLLHLVVAIGVVFFVFNFVGQILLWHIVVRIRMRIFIALTMAKLFSTFIVAVL